MGKKREESREDFFRSDALFVVIRGDDDAGWWWTVYDGDDWGCRSGVFSTAGSALNALPRQWRRLPTLVVDLTTPPVRKRIIKRTAELATVN